MIPEGRSPLGIVGSVTNKYGYDLSERIDMAKIWQEITALFVIDPGAWQVKIIASARTPHNLSNSRMNVPARLTGPLE